MNIKHSLDEKIEFLMEKETEGVGFGKEAREKVLKHINKRNTFFKRFMEKEIEIPVSPVLAAVTILITLSVYTLNPCLKITETDIRENTVYILSLNGGIADEN